jgi:hypothetical protein
MMIIPSTMMNLSKLSLEKIFLQLQQRVKELLADKQDLKKQLEMMKSLIEDNNFIADLEDASEHRKDTKFRD